MKKILIITFAFLLFFPADLTSQRKRNQKENAKSENVSLNAFKFRKLIYINLFFNLQN